MLIQRFLLDLRLHPEFCRVEPDEMVEVERFHRIILLNVAKLYDGVPAVEVGFEQLVLSLIHKVASDFKPGEETFLHSRFSYWTGFARAVYQACKEWTEFNGKPEIVDVY